MPLLTLHNIFYSKGTHKRATAMLRATFLMFFELLSLLYTSLFRHHTAVITLK